jgi:hypothetical protein
MSVYLELFHGRKTTDEEMDGWGEMGPILGPLNSFQVTYGWMRIIYDNDFIELNDTEGLIYYNGIYYGDFAVIDEETALKHKDRIESPKEEFTKLPGKEEVTCQ